MLKRRLHELSKEFNIGSKEIIAYLNEIGVTQKTQKSTLEEKELDIVFSYYTEKYAVESIEAFVEKYNSTEETVEVAPVKEEAPKAEKEEKTEKAPKAKGEKKEKAPAKEEKTIKTEKTKEVKKPVAVDEEELKKVMNAPIEKKVRYVDTRTSNVDLDKMDDEKIEKILTTDDIYGTANKKQKIKKGGYGPSKKMDKFDKNKKKNEPKKIEPVHIKIPNEITVAELATRLKKTSSEVIKQIMMLTGDMISLNQMVDFDTAALITEELGATYEREIILSLEEQLFVQEDDNEADMEERSPVVVVMGHVDHGKTSLLDAIRNANVTSTEAGGITQHIGAYRVNVDGKDITFLDTPGHEAFTAMRARGAQATDIAILVVAADDGIMPQTVEAINHAKAANVTVIVAINKMDKEGANPDRVMQALTEYDLVPEEWGGDTICVPVSALKRENIDKLLEMVLLIAEVKELKANPNRPAEGIVIEAKLDKGRGPVATVLVQKGTLHVGDYVVAGTTSGKVRAMINDKGKNVKVAGPSMPVEIVGLGEVPVGGDTFNAVNDERKAKQLIESRKFDQKEEQFKSQSKVTLDNLFAHINEGNVKDLNIIVKADVQGSVEAVRQSLVKLSNEEVRVNVIHGAVGAVNESDVMLANASNAIIVGFNVRPNAGATASAERENVEIRLYRVIYQAIEEIEAAMKGMLAPKYVEKVIGHAEIRETYKITGVGTIAGCYVKDGSIQRNCDVRVVRDGIVIFEGHLNSLKRFKDDVKEVAEGFECGLGIEKYNDIKVEDIIECFIQEEVKQ